MDLTTFHFIRPWGLLALIPLPFLLWFAVGMLRQGGQWQACCDQHLLTFLLEGQQQKSGRWRHWLFALAWLIGVLALAGPSWDKQSVPLFQTQNARVILLDLSRSMLSSDLSPNRLDQARFKLADALSSVDEGQTALVVFAAQAYVVTPLTDDNETIIAMLAALTPDIMPAQGSRIDRAVEKAVSLLQQAGQVRGEILIITDASPDRRDRNAVINAAKDGYSTSVLAVGTPEGAPIALPRGGFLKDARGNIVVPGVDLPALRDLVAAGGGRFSPLTSDNRDLGYLLSGWDSAGDGSRESSDRTAEIWRDQGPWLVLLLLPMALLAFRRGGILAIFLLFGLQQAPSAQALAWQDIWQTRDQQAGEALRQGELETAREVASDSAILAEANYRLDDFAAAAEAYANAEGADAHYNRGNALARLNQYEEAISEYDQALSLSAEMPDALANKALLEQLQQQQQQQQQDQSEKSEDSDSEQEEGEGQQQEGESGEQQEQEDEGSAESQQQKEGEQEGDEQKEGQEQEEEQKEKEAEQQQGEQDEDQEGEESQQALTEAEELSDEERQAVEQWLRKIPDDPGGLLRRKFLMQYRDLGRNRNEKNDW